jgi:hypothetical protein
MADSDSPQIKLFRECSRAFLTRDTALLAKTTHADYRYVPYPRSLGKPEQKKEEFLEHWAEAMSHWTPDTEVGCIGCSSDPFTATKSLPQPTFRFITDTPGIVVAHVRT